ncbi:uncharacterized protein Triagg1_609 [Trichoderma aggressivum f. europaeum]|uniref:Uncharacterized protein n=1 Tax=Trichoderma aggressivum f. europaeum TaxID=173218 RepID=A0AAE1INM6_9HYPO|nr:hypothetical protein Triagg1_609 [Trichoderma aggressivum f. europaeum]
MPRPPPMNPLPIVTNFPWRLSKDQMNGLRSHYRSVCVDRYATDQSIDKFYKALVIGIFRFLGSDDQRYQECLNACIDMCKSTKVIEAASWTGWRGFAKFLEMMEKTERLTRHTELLHCPAAPYLVVAVAMQQVVLHGSKDENSKAHAFFRDFDTHNKAATAIYFYEMHWRQEYLTLDQPWDLTPSALQRMPNTKIHQINGRVVIQKLRTPRDHTSNEVIEVKDEQTPIKRESAAAHQASEFREERREAPMPMPAETQTITRMPVPMSIPTPVPARVPVPAQITMPAPVPNPAPTSVFAPRPVRVRETLMEVFRGDVMAKLQPLLDRLKSENWNGIIQRDIMEVLTDKNVRVLPSLAKQTVRLWATRSQKAMLLSWLEQARDDVDVFQWTERFVEPAPSAWTIPQSAHSVFHDLDAVITRVPQLDIRGLLQAKMGTLRDIFDQQEKSHKEEMLHRVDSLQIDIAKLHGEMAASKQMSGQAVAESAATDNDAAMTDRDVVIIETDDDTTDDSEVERKKKKRKGEKKERKRDKQGGEEKMKKKKTKTGESDKKKKKKRSHQEMELD